MRLWHDDLLELKAWLAVLRLPRVGAVTFVKLLDQYDELKQLFSLSSARLKCAGLGSQAVSLVNITRLEDLAAGETHNVLLAGVSEDIRWACRENNHIVCYKDQDYPSLLKEIHDPPPVLFVAGDPALLNYRQLGIVGSRSPSQLGLMNTRCFSQYLVEQGMVVSSGLAAGIDGEAHQAALDAGGFTIAVAGHGLDQIYPRHHLRLAQSIRQAGAVISEFPIGTQLRPQLFPRRNRIISGLSEGVLVVEAALKSGSLITARMAMEQGREVFAIPGSIHNPLSRGCHQLIKQGAKLVESGEDIFHELQGFEALAQNAVAGRIRQPVDKKPAEKVEHSPLAVSPPVKRVLSLPDMKLSAEEEKVLQFIEIDPLPFDLIVERSGIEARVVASLLVMLELDGCVYQEAGGYCRQLMEQ